MIRVDLTTTFPTVDDIMARFRSGVRADLTILASETEAEIKARWVGWKYEGRPKTAPRNVSQEAWMVEVGDDLALRIRNEARDYRYRRSYVKYVHRAGRRPQETAWGDIAADIEPKTIERIRDIMARGIQEAVRPTNRREVT